jgi:cation diffusion facilitator family transporter
VRRRITVYAAIAANLAIAITKFMAAAVTSSGAMYSEGIHSAVDTGDGLLLLLGLHLSRRPATADHPYGRGHEVYFWSMVVVMAIFGIGGGLSIYEGIHHLVIRQEPTAVTWAYLVLAIAFVFEGASWIIAKRGFVQTYGEGMSMWQGIRTSKDPTQFCILLEDSAALAGIVIAAVGITLAHLLDAPAIDAVASILIGVLLCAVAVILGRETWSLVIGESAAPAIVESIQRIARAQHGVLDAGVPHTLHLGPNRIHVDLDVRLDPAGSVDDAAATVSAIEDAVRHEHPSVGHVAVRFRDW